jgi:hypothetical protein
VAAFAASVRSDDHRLAARQIKIKLGEGEKIGRSDIGQVHAVQQSSSLVPVRGASPVLDGGAAGQPGRPPTLQGS